jgi:peptidoglycan hydrolase CwlO-like protein
MVICLSPFVTTLQACPLPDCSDEKSDLTAAKQTYKQCLNAYNSILSNLKQTQADLDVARAEWDVLVAILKAYADMGVPAPPDLPFKILAAGNKVRSLQNTVNTLTNSLNQAKSNLASAITQLASAIVSWLLAWVAYLVCLAFGS